MALVHGSIWINKEIGSFVITGLDDRCEAFDLVFASHESLKDFVVQLREQLTNDGTLTDETD